MKASRLLMVLSSLGSLAIAILPAFIVSNRRLHSRKELRDVNQRLDAYGSRQ
jgi:hypothetical protein